MRLHFKEHELGEQESNDKMEQFVITAVLCSVQQLLDKNRSGDEFFYVEDMKAMNKLWDEVLMPGAHGHVLCSALLFGQGNAVAEGDWGVERIWRIRILFVSSVVQEK